MRGVRIAQHGGSEVLEWTELAEPEPGPGEVLVSVKHVALNHLDLWVRRGVPGHRFPLPLIPCSDAAGVREDTGEAVALMPALACMACRRCLAGEHNLCRGYRIRGEGVDGWLRQRVAVPSWQLLPLPDQLDTAQAAALPLSLLTAWHMLVGRAGVGPGDRVLVQGGAGGVGSLAIQVARHCGARVVATASTAHKRERCVALGAEAAWPYAEAVAACRAWTDREGVDIVVESTGALTWEDSLRVVRWGGTVVTCGATAGHEVPLNLRALFFKQISLLGSTMGSFGELRSAWDAVGSGAIVPVVDRVMPVSELAQAHALLEGREVAGKLVLAL